MAYGNYSTRLYGVRLVSLAVAAIVGFCAIPMASAQDNTVFGVNVLPGGSGTFNSAFGENILEDNTSGCHNTIAGYQAMMINTTGSYNTADGLQTLQNNTTGDNNTAVGYNALDTNSTGSTNIALGQLAGSALTTGSNNIDIGNNGTAGESGIIRIGTGGTQTGAFIAGISSDKLSAGTPVVVTGAGRLGVLSSSARYKRDIRDMGAASDKLMKLRPVTFRYKADPTGAQQYGLIAEEVAKVYPELVIRGDDGKPETVAYHLLPAMLLNEAQKQAHELSQKDEQIATLQREVSALKQKVTQIDALSARLDALELQARTSGGEHLASAMR